MPSINISEQEFALVAGAANDAWDAGDETAAVLLDKLARKMNAALSNNIIQSPFSKQRNPLTWKDVPSTLVGKVK